MSKIGVLMQYRTQNSRFPNKGEQMIGDKSLVEHCVDNIHKSKVEFFAMSIPREGIEDWDVLSRAIADAEQYDLTHIIRVCGDNPFIDPERINKLITFADMYDYVSYQIDGIPAILAKTGVHAEACSLGALKLLNEIIPKKPTPAREHYTIGLYTNPRFDSLLIPDTYDGPSLTVDTPEDLERVRKWYESSQK